MIRYTSRSGFVCLSWFTCRSAVTTFKVPLLVSLFAAFATLGVGILKQTSPVLFSHASLNSTTYGTFSSLVGFMVVFRTSQGYGRFWEGASMVHKMTGEWYAAVSTLFAYCRHSRANEELVTDFQQRVLRYMSFLNALILARLENALEDDDHAQALTFPLLDVAGLDHESIMSLDGIDNKQEVVFQWIQTLMVEAIDSGVMNIAPPLLTRAFQQLGNGMICYHEMLKFPNVPLPFPFMIATEVLLLLHLAISPVMLVSWFDNLVLPTAFAFILVLALWSLHVIAGELENPFGSDDNDLDMRAMQTRLNSRLVELISDPAQKPPKLACASGSVHRLKDFSDSWAVVHTSSSAALLQPDDSGKQSITPPEETVTGEAGDLDMERYGMPCPARQATNTTSSVSLPIFQSGSVERRDVPDTTAALQPSRESNRFTTEDAESPSMGSSYFGDLEAQRMKRNWTV